MRWAVLLTLLVACTGPTPSRRQGTNAFQGAGHERFFLPELPNWANGSLSAGCQRPFSVRFLDYAALEQVHALDFRSRVELQAQFNFRWRERFVGKTALVLSPQEEAALFSASLSQVKGGLRDLRFPEGRRFQLVWWDSLREGPKFKQWLKRLLENSPDPVVLVSLCEGRDDLGAWLAQEGLDDLDPFLIGAEVLGPQRMDGSFAPGAVMPLDVFFNPAATTLWSGKVPYPAELPKGYVVKTVEE